MKKIFMIFTILILGLSACITPKPYSNVTPGDNPKDLNKPLAMQKDNTPNLYSIPWSGPSGHEFKSLPTLDIFTTINPLAGTLSEPSKIYRDGIADGINPLTGLPVKNPDFLNLPPALLVITNWPATARPQAGLSFTPIVFEWYIGEGMSRYLALFYGDFPDQNANDNSSGNSGDVTFGPIRSGRLPFEKIRSLYNGFLIMASAYQGVAQHLSSFANIFGSDQGDINSAMIKFTQLQEIANNSQKKLGNISLSGMVFDSNPPAGGKPASRLWFMYNILNQIIWNYNESTGFYNRYQYNDDKKTFIEDTDRLNGNDLAYSNIVILFAQHHACTEMAYDVDLMYLDRQPAILFRDGQVYNILWSTKNEGYENSTGNVRPIRFTDDKGQPFPFKPGQTWIHVVPPGNSLWEAAPSADVDAMITDQKEVDSSLLYNWIFRKKQDSGIWASQYRASLMIHDNAVCTEIHTLQ